MKKYFLLLAFVLMCISGTHAKIKYVTANLNLRTEPTTNSRVITTIPRGTSIDIEDDCQCLWVPVYYNGYVGYVCTKYVSSQAPIVKVARPQSTVRYYTNTYGETVQAPTRYSSQPVGATALCRDGTYSFSQSRRGTCSGHGGVASWL